MQCQHCGDDLPSDCPDGITSCREYAEWFAQRRGATLTADEANALSLMAFYCGRNAALGRMGDMPHGLRLSCRKKN